MPHPRSASFNTSWTSALLSSKKLSCCHIHQETADGTLKHSNWETTMKSPFTKVLIELRGTKKAWCSISVQTTIRIQILLLLRWEGKAKKQCWNLKRVAIEREPLDTWPLVEGYMMNCTEGSRGNKYYNCTLFSASDHLSVLALADLTQKPEGKRVHGRSP